MKNLDLTIEEIQAEAAQKIEAAKVKFDAIEKTGIEDSNIIAYSPKNIGFGWREPLTKEQVKAVLDIYPVSGDNYKMKFASSKDNFDTDSPTVVRWDNGSSYKKEFKIVYQSNGTEIQITVPPSHFGSHVYYNKRQGKHIGFGRYEYFNDMNIDYFYTQKYSGGYNVLYFLEGAEKHEEYLNFIFTGEFKYSNEL